MKKIYLFAISNLFTPVAFADAGTSGISDAADGVVTYMPYVRALCYVIAAIIAVVGALAVYYTMQTNPLLFAFPLLCPSSSALTAVCLEMAAVLLVQEQAVQAMAFLPLTKAVSHKAVLSPTYPPSVTGQVTGLPFRREPIWLLPTSLSISMSNMDYNTFNQMMSAAGNLPHN